MNTLQYAPVYFHPIGVIGTMRRMAQPTINSVLTTLMARKNINAHQLAAELVKDDPAPEEQKKNYQPTIWRILDTPDYTPTLPTLRVLAAYFEVTVSQLIGETPLECDDDTDAVLRAMQAMAPYRKAALVSMARTLASDDARSATAEPAAPSDTGHTEARQPPKRPATAVTGGPPKHHRAKKTGKQEKEK
jgi:hypothetical protein